MKTYRLILSIFFSSSFLILNGQYFIGGNIHVNNTSNKTESQNNLTQNASNFGLTFSPICAKFLTEKLALGMGIDLALNRLKSGVSTEVINNSPSIGVEPFIRYYGWTWGKFSVFGEGYLELQFSKSTQKINNNTTNGPHSTSIFLGIFPGLSYALTEKFFIQTGINFLNLSYSYTLTRDGSTKDKVSTINFGTGLDNIISISNLTVGAIYKF